MSRKGKRMFYRVRVRLGLLCAHACTDLYKKNLVVESYLINSSFKFRKDPSFHSGDIPLFVTVYDLELKILSFSNPSKNAILSGKKRTLRFIFFKTIFDNDTQKPFI